MKTLLSTTALLLGLGMPTLMLAQTEAPAEATATTQAAADMPGFLAMRGEADVFASELIGRDVYARRVVEGSTDTTATAPTAGTMTQIARADLDNMDNIGQINEIVLSNDGQVRAIVIGVGGFLGMGEQDVAVTMDQVTFAADPEDRSEMYVVVNTGAEMLKASPRYERNAMSGDAMTGTANDAAATDTTATDTTATDTTATDTTATDTTATDTTATDTTATGTAATDATANDTAVTGTTTGDRTAFVAPKIDRDGYNPVEVTEMSSEMLVGKTVYSVNDDSVGTIDDLLLDDQGAITNVIIDFGGFLGMGTSQVSVGFDELTILADEGRTDVRVYVDATKEQIQAQPQYRASN